MGFSISGKRKTGAEARREAYREGRTAHGAVYVAAAVEDYLEHIAEKPSGYEVRNRLDAYLTPELASADVAKLTKEVLEAWHRGHC